MKVPIDDYACIDLDAPTLALGIALFVQAEDEIS